LRAMDHPVLPRCFGANLETDRPYIVLEYVDGPRLSTVIRRQRLLGVEQVVPLLQQVTAALHYLHGKGLVHLDVKPKNVIMSPPPRLIDLSVARGIEAARETRRPVGTDPYMAPEQCVPREEAPAPIGPATDVWGLGATLFHAVSGEKPFARGTGKDGAGRFPQLVEGPKPLPSRVPEELSRLIYETLDRDPASRPSCAEVVERLQPLVAALPRKMTLSRRGPLR
jgi:eukaryotic-like serine/threonine-protein kinase